MCYETGQFYLLLTALTQCRQIVGDPADEAEYEFAVSFAHRILPKHDPRREDLPDLIGDDFRIRDIGVSADPALHVEELARRWFEERGDHAWYVENALFPALFGLAFWDIIFLPRKGVFFNPFQRGPADLFTPEFRIATASLMGARFEELADLSSFRQRIFDTFAAKVPIANWFVSWPALSEALLERVFDRVPVAHILSVFKRMLRDLKRNRSGFPDLIVFPNAGGYLLAEVKGPGDTLQNNQKRWLRHFRDLQMPAEIVNVTWTGQ